MDAIIEHAVPRYSGHMYFYSCCAYVFRTHVSERLLVAVQLLLRIMSSDVYFYQSRKRSARVISQGLLCSPLCSIERPMVHAVVFVDSLFSVVRSHQSP